MIVSEAEVLKEVRNELIAVAECYKKAPLGAAGVFLAVSVHICKKQNLPLDDVIRTILKAWKG